MNNQSFLKSATIATACAIAAMLAACGEVPKDTPTSGSTGSSTYTVGGTVSGLNTTGLTIANGSDSVDLASGATSFTMPTALATGATYAMSITKAPQGFILACSLATATGTVASANITSAVVSCGPSSATVSTASLSSQGFADGGTLAASAFFNPVSIARDATGNTYILDAGNLAIRKISVSGSVSTLYTGLSAPTSMTLAKDGNLYVYDTRTVVQVTPAGVATTIAGSMLGSGFVDGTGNAAQFDNGLTGQGFIAADPVSGNLYVADSSNHSIRMVTPAGVVTTVAGNGLAGTATPSVVSSSAQFTNPVGISVDSAGNIYVGDTGNSVIREIKTTGTTDIVIGTGISGSVDSATAINAQVVDFANFAFDSSGNLYFTEPSTGKIRMYNATNGVTTIAGTTAGFADGPKATAKLQPRGLAIDVLGNAWVADSVNNAIRNITP